MTLPEFKAWFEGFTENIKGVPTQKQWARIRERVGQIDGTVLTQEVIHRYWPWYTTTPTYYSTIGGTSCGSISGGLLSNTNSTYTALSNIGKMEATET